MKKMNPGYSVEPMLKNTDYGVNTRVFEVNKSLKIDPAFPIIVKFTGLNAIGEDPFPAYGLLWIDPFEASLAQNDAEHFILPFCSYRESNNKAYAQRIVVPSSFDDGFVYSYDQSRVTISMQFDAAVEVSATEDLKAELLYVPYNGPGQPLGFNVEY